VPNLQSSGSGATDSQRGTGKKKPGRAIKATPKITNLEMPCLLRRAGGGSDGHKRAKRHREGGMGGVCSRKLVKGGTAGGTGKHLVKEEKSTRGQRGGSAG